MPRLVKRDQAREPFDETKLRSGMVRALERRPVNAEAIEESIARIIHAMQTLGEREISSRILGEMVMEELRALDEVAYVRFASVYRRFQDVNEFQEEIERLRDATSQDASPRTDVNCCPTTANPEPDAMNATDKHVEADADYMVRALRTGRAGCTRRIRTRASAASLSGIGRSSARAGMQSPAVRTPKSSRSKRPVTGAGGDGLRHARAVLSSWAHAAVHDALINAGIARVVYRLRRSESRRVGRGCGASCRPQASDVQGGVLDITGG